MLCFFTSNDALKHCLGILVLTHKHDLCAICCSQVKILDLFLLREEPSDFLWGFEQQVEIYILACMQKSAYWYTSMGIKKSLSKGRIPQGKKI